MSEVCQQRALPDAPQSELSFGCVCCAPFQQCSPGMQVSDAPERVYWPHLTLAGSFTAVGLEQRVLAMDGCESHAENYGGLLVLTRRGDGFVLERYVSGLNPKECRSFRRDDGRDLLVCRAMDAHQGLASESVWQWDLATEETALQAQEPFLFTEDQELSGCMSPLGTHVSSVRIRRFDDVVRAGRPELMVELDVREGAVTAQYLERCEEAERGFSAGQPPVSLPEARQILPARSERRRFRFDGARFLAR